MPSWRVDVLREIDLIEEVARHYGYDRLPMHFPELREMSPAPDARIDRDDLARRILIAVGSVYCVFRKILTIHLADGPGCGFRRVRGSDIITERLDSILFLEDHCHHGA